MSTTPSHPADRGPSHVKAKIAIPVLIGLAAVVLLFHGEFSKADLSTVPWSARSVGAIFLAWLFMAGRDFGLTWRFRELTLHHLSWLKALKVNMLCEFTSAITPSSGGGSAMGMVYMHREGIEWGRSATLTLTILFLDELYFVLVCPLIFLWVGHSELFSFTQGSHDAFLVGLRTAFWTVYVILTLWVGLLFVGIFVKPHAVRGVLIKLFRLRWLRRWQGKVQELGDNIVATSAVLRRRSMVWWLRVFAATALSWTSRFLVINMLFWGFLPDAPQDVILSRQIVVWVVLKLSPTPGGSGVSEWIFKNYYGDLISDGALVMVLAVLWRIISYYVYLVIGAVIMPRWVADGIRLRREKRGDTGRRAGNPPHRG